MVCTKKKALDHCPTANNKFHQSRKQVGRKGENSPQLSPPLTTSPLTLLTSQLSPPHLSLSSPLTLLTSPRHLTSHSPHLPTLTTSLLTLLTSPRHLTSHSPHLPSPPHLSLSSPPLATSPLTLLTSPRHLTSHSPHLPSPPHLSLSSPPNSRHLTSHSPHLPSPPHLSLSSPPLATSPHTLLTSPRHLTSHSPHLSLSSPSSDSPFITEELSLFMLTTVPPRRCMAAWKEEDVRVLTS